MFCVRGLLICLLLLLSSNGLMSSAAHRLFFQPRHFPGESNPTDAVQGKQVKEERALGEGNTCKKGVCNAGEEEKRERGTTGGRLKKERSPEEVVEMDYAQPHRKPPIHNHMP